MSFIKPKLWQIPTPNNEVIASLEDKVQTLTERLQQIAQQHQQARFASSLAVEDMLITDIIAKQHLPIQVFTLDTGLLHSETLDLLQQIPHIYPHLAFQIFQPQADKAEQFVQEFGKQAYYESVALRKQCCYIRKIEPLNRALEGADAWLTGQRREQSVTRTELAFAEQDEARAMAKYNPIFDWSEQQVWAYILHYQVPYNPLYLQGFPSIGCDPCTRPVKEGEDIRAGRWWWENKDSKECGLHK
ncbi:phosphoadenosine phosphosulfate reductase [Volucribacter psittacicida]|uniref:Adenosine 5'-phosphosulfate reductase n=1 Tax=Volucribacter psittacicida TaxID=203482 RepID=A0A4R1FQG1_9PAST|nr:phosphoadenylyl-sulfate reductase [Volucribacter psittacicida]TCJ95822.1 phosphoadenosine phosphosulfate reductase [Volucribacter psittacicida]